MLKPVLTPRMRTGAGWRGLTPAERTEAVVIGYYGLCTKREGYTGKQVTLAFTQGYPGRQVRGYADRLVNFFSSNYEYSR